MSADAGAGPLPLTLRRLGLSGRGAGPTRIDAATAELAEEARRRRIARMAARDRLTSLAVASTFVAVALALAVLVPTHRSPSPLTVLLLVALLAGASRIEFEVGAGSGVPTQLVLIPMLFLLPVGQVPLWVAAGYVLAELPRRMRARRHAERLLVQVCASWHAVGPACVLALAGERALSWSDWPLYAAALCAQFLFDWIAAGLRDHFAHGVPVRRLAAYLLRVHAVDLALAPIGLLAAFAAFEAGEALVVLVVPLVGLLAILSRERRARIDHALELSRAYRGTGRLAETFHDILSEETLDSTLTKIADVLGELIAYDALTIAETTEGGDLVPALTRGVIPEDKEHALIEVPLMSRGQCKGLLSVHRLAAGASFGRDEEQLASWFADAATLAIENMRIRAVLEQQASSDSLTGLINHRTFQEKLRDQLAQLRESKGTLALLMFDIDDFKRINDVYGHAAGDEVLVEVAELLRRVARTGDEVCRVGGEEFTVIMPAANAAAGLLLARRLVAGLSSCELGPVSAITLSIGIAEAPVHALSARELIACAEGAMMSAKSKGKNRIVTYGGETLVRPGDGGESRRAEDLRSIAHLKLLQSLAGKLSRMNDVTAIGEAIVSELRSLFDCNSCRVYVTSGDLLVPAAWYGELAYADESAEALTTRIGEGITGTAAQTGQSLLISDAENCEFAVHVPGSPHVEESVVAVPLRGGSQVHGVIVLSKLGLEQFDEDDVRLLEVLAPHAAAVIQNAVLYETVRDEAESLERTFVSTVEALANALEANDADTSSHARAISDLALSLGRRLELDAEALKRLELGALFHDIGKIGIPSEILTKPGPLTPEERVIVEAHPELGERILEPIERLADVRPIVRHCHERWDGAGYPDRLRGTEIPLESRIILVVDAYHAMTSDRPYRARRPHAEACETLRREAGRQFDPVIVDAFLTLAEEDLAPLEQLVA
jgi:diguanylate cyclase (GGDEF)-like protein